jgi:hypothetical protein
MRGPRWVYALITSFALSVGFNAPTAGNFKGSGIYVVKHEPSTLIEGIEIFNSAPYENALCSVLYGGEIIHTYGNKPGDDGFGAWTHDGPGSRFVASVHLAGLPSLVRCTPFRLKKRPPARGQRWKWH